MPPDGAAAVGGCMKALCTVVRLYLSIGLGHATRCWCPDDTYIHFHARQMAPGAFAYHPGAPATSGGTSLLYPAVLALGYRLGFTGWSLAYWALALGALAFAGAAWLVYRIGANNPLVGEAAADGGIAFALALTFALTGPFLWAAQWMETVLFCCSCRRLTRQQGALWRRSWRRPLMRPEGLFWRRLTPRDGPGPGRMHARSVRRLALAVPVLAVLSSRDQPCAIGERLVIRHDGSPIYDR